MEKFTKVGHLADAHLRDSQYGAKSRSNDFFQGFLNGILCCMEHGCRTIIHAGDMLNNTRPSPTLLEQAKQIQKLLIDNQSVLYVISGNHDLTDPYWTDIIDIQESPYGIKNINNKYVKCLDSPISIYGLPYMPTVSLIDLFNKEDPEAPLFHADVLTWHGAVKEFCGYETSSMLSIEDFPETYKLIALGDLHTHAKKTRVNGQIIAYPGSSELVSIAEDDIKKAYVYTFNNETHNLEKIEEPSYVTRHVQRINVNTEEELTEALSSIKENSFIVFTYDKSIPNVAQRLYALNKNNFIRYIPKDINRTIEVQRRTACFSLHEALDSCVAQENDAYTLLKELLDPSTDATTSIEQFILSKLNMTTL